MSGSDAHVDDSAAADKEQKNVTTLREQLLLVEMFKAGVPETTIDVLRAARIFNVTDIDTADAKIVDLKQDLKVCRLLCTPIFILSFSHPFATCVGVATVGTAMRNGTPSLLCME